MSNPKSFDTFIWRGSLGVQKTATIITEAPMLR